ncbi:Dicer-like protein 2 [Haplosporangium sp. Z 27]|nr:Dicer-like protein 2 [Haplosporangium sp. Z 27]
MNPSEQTAVSATTSTTANHQQTDYAKVIKLYCERLGPRRPIYSFRVVPRNGYTCVLTLPMNIIRPVVSSTQRNKKLTIWDASRLACILLIEKHELDGNYNVLRPMFQAPVFPAFGNIKVSEAEQQQLGLDSIDIKILTTALTPKTNSATSSNWEGVGEAFMNFFFASYFFARYQDDLEGALTCRISNEACRAVTSKHIQSSVLNRYVCAGNTGLKKTRELSIAVFRRIIGAFAIYGGLDAALKASWILDASVDGSIASMKDIQIVYQTNRPEDLSKSVTNLEEPMELDAIMAVRIEEVQRALRYTFKDVRILIEALAHESVRRKSPEKRSYNRLELLGDGVLEYIIVEHYYNLYPTTSCKDLKSFTSFSLCNNSLGSFYASLGLQTTLMTDLGLGNTWIEDAVDVVWDRARGITNMENLHLSKILGDAMEALEISRTAKEIADMLGGSPNMYNDVRETMENVNIVALQKAREEFL